MQPNNGNLKIVLGTKSGLKFLAISAILSLLFAPGALAQELDSDVQNWNVVRLSVPLYERWAFSLQGEVRLSDNITKVDEIIFKAYTHYKFGEKFGLSFGYKYIDRPNDSNETDPWQEAVFPRKYGMFHVGHQIRLEERLYDGLPGVLPRIRYLLNFNRPIGSSIAYVTGFGAIRFNLAEKDAGPVAGFEQFRVNAGVGFHLGGYTRLEIGYLYKYEVIREDANFSGNVIHFQLIFTTHKNEKKQPRANYNFH